MVVAQLMPDENFVAVYVGPEKEASPRRTRSRSSPPSPR
jgi:hypothetical protein